MRPVGFGPRIIRPSAVLSFRLLRRMFRPVARHKADFCGKTFLSFPATNAKATAPLQPLGWFSVAQEFDPEEHGTYRLNAM